MEWGIYYWRENSEIGSSWIWIPLEYEFRLWIHPTTPILPLPNLLFGLSLMLRNDHSNFSSIFLHQWLANFTLPFFLFFFKSSSNRIWTSLYLPSIISLKDEWQSGLKFSTKNYYEFPNLKVSVSYVYISFIPDKIVLVLIVASTFQVNVLIAKGYIVFKFNTKY